jgi:hypothetical protein
VCMRAVLRRLRYFDCITSSKRKWIGWSYLYTIFDKLCFKVKQELLGRNLAAYLTLVAPICLARTAKIINCNCTIS